VRSPYLTASEAADVLRCDRRRIYRMVHDGRIAGVKDGSRVLVERASIEAYLRRE
jgi:excisionase family DNA binding protein